VAPSSPTPAFGVELTRIVTLGPTTGEAPIVAGRRLADRYHVIRLVGVGGMGAVYEAWDETLGVAVALKVILPPSADDPGARADLERRFTTELLLARQVTHKNVVRIHDLGEFDGIKYITMPYIEGLNLASVLAGSRLTVGRALHLARQIAAGLAAAHDAGIVHRDLKPPNIMVDNDDRALIMDFGIARSASAAAGDTAAIVGTLDYMAPEQALGGPVDHRADIFAFGLMLY
jgi:serine/threonine protein kinase